MSLTQRFAFTKVGGSAGGSITDDGSKFTLADRDTLDRILAAAETHDHRGGEKLGDPVDNLTLALSATGGSLPANKTCYYKVSFIDQFGLETAASNEFAVLTPQPLGIPGQPHLATAEGGFLVTGVFYYAISAVLGTDETQLGPSTLIAVPADRGTVTVTLPMAPEGADGLAIWRQAPLDSGFTKIATVALDVPTFDDDGSIPSDICPCDPTHLPSSSNATFSTNSVTISLGDVDAARVNVPDSPIKKWRIYRSFQSGVYGGKSLVHETVETDVDTGFLVTSWVDDGSDLLEGAPSFYSQALMPSQPVQTQAEVVNALPANTGARRNGELVVLLPDYNLYMWDAAAEAGVGAWEQLTAGGFTAGKHLPISKAHPAPIFDFQPTLETLAADFVLRDQPGGGVDVPLNGDYYVDTDPNYTGLTGQIQETRLDPGAGFRSKVVDITDTTGLPAGITKAVRVAHVSNDNGGSNYIPALRFWTPDSNTDTGAFALGKNQIVKMFIRYNHGPGSSSNAFLFGVYDLPAGNVGGIDANGEDVLGYGGLSAYQYVETNDYDDDSVWREITVNTTPESSGFQVDIAPIFNQPGAWADPDSSWDICGVRFYESDTGQDGDLYWSEADSRLWKFDARYGWIQRGAYYRQQAQGEITFQDDGFQVVHMEDTYFQNLYDIMGKAYSHRTAMIPVKFVATGVTPDAGGPTEVALHPAGSPSGIPHFLVPAALSFGNGALPYEYTAISSAVIPHDGITVPFRVYRTSPLGSPVPYPAFDQIPVFFGYTGALPEVWSAVGFDPTNPDNALTGGDHLTVAISLPAAADCNAGPFDVEITLYFAAASLNF